MKTLSLIASLAFLAVPITSRPATPSHKPSPRPLVLWHGLGDSHSSEGMVEFASMIKDMHPGIFIHSVYIAEDEKEDRQAGFYGHVNDQIELVAEQLAEIDELKGGFDAIGFSQGGQFLRAYNERYNTPPIRNLITFGSQHMGITDIPICRPGDFMCQLARRATKAAVYGSYAQNNLVQAQYFRDVNNLPRYLEANHFLTSINNEIPGSRNETYARHFASLENLVLVIFTKDKTVVPKESAWFGSEAPPDDFTQAASEVDQQPLASPLNAYAPPVVKIIPMREQPLYKEDWIGLRELDERGAVVFASCESEHMHMSGCWEDLVEKYVGSSE